LSGYTRQDLTGEIATGQIVEAAPLNAEFNAITTAFSAASGHTHSGLTGEGPPITVVGPAQDVTISVVSMSPKTDNTLDLGSATFEYKDLWIDGTANIDTLAADAGTVGGAAIATLTQAQTLTNKTIDLTNNALIATSAQLAAAVTDETGTGSLTFATSPALAGVPTAPTAAADTNTTQLATTAHVFAERSNVATLTNKVLTTPSITGAEIGSASTITDSSLSNVTITDSDITGESYINTTAVGSAATPTIQFAAGLGLYRPFASTLGISAGGSLQIAVEDGYFYTAVPVIGEGARYLPILARVVGGTANAITLTAFDVDTLLAGQQVRFLATVTNTGATTINLDTSGTTTCKTLTGAALPAGYIRTDVYTTATYNGTDWIVDREPEYGSNANGYYWRYADGRQECYLRKQITYTAATYMSATWSFPASFASGTLANVNANIDATSWGGNVPAGLAMGDVETAIGNALNTYAGIQVWTRTGAVSLVGGNNCYVYCAAVGRWY